MSESLAKQTRLAKQSQSTKRMAILLALKNAGPQGKTNLELNEICFRYGGRIHELRKEFEIEKEYEGAGVFRYIFRGVKQPKQRSLFAQVA